MRAGLLYGTRDELHPSPTGTLSLREAKPNVKKLFDMLHQNLQSFSTDWKPHLSSKLQAEYHYVMGKFLVIFEEHGEEAEDNLQKAAAGALDFDMFDIMCEKSIVKAKLVLAMLKGNAVTDIENVAESMEQLSKECIEDAKQAALFDVKMVNCLGKGWCCVGNAYLINWFATGCGDVEQLSLSMKAFGKVGTMKENPYCCYNFALASKYYGDYASALAGFKFAAKTNADAVREIETIVAMLQMVESNSTRGHGRGGTSEQSKNTRTLNLLNEGPNEGKKLLGKVKDLLQKENGPLLHFLLSDPDQTDFVLSIYGVCDNVIRKGDQLTLEDPYFRNVNISWEQKDYNYKAIFLNCPEHLLLNKKPLKDEEKMAVTFQNSMRI